MAGTDGEADALVGTVEDHIEALHDNGAHDGARGGLGNGELVAVVLRGGHVLHWAQVLLQEERRRRERRGDEAELPGAGSYAHPARSCPRDPLRPALPLGTGQGLAGPTLTWGRMVIRKDWLVASPIR